MIVLDAYAVVAILADEPAGEDVAALLEQGDCGISVLNLAEAADVLERSHGIEATATRDAVDTLVGAGALTAVDVDERRAWRAAELRTRHYRRHDSAVSLADCVLLASVRPGLDAVATPDAPVLAIARLEGLEAIPLPDSAGHRPS
ncbi:MAG: PIN domain-containing protein [Thermoleophilia bacterium]|nr:PIN domain-containing protein [Thermoleophilia bacterium]